MVLYLYFRQIGKLPSMGRTWLSSGPYATWRSNENDISEHETTNLETPMA